MQTIVFSWERISQSGPMIQTQSGLGDGLGAVVVLAEIDSPGEVMQLQKRPSRRCASVRRSPELHAELLLLGGGVELGSLGRSRLLPWGLEVAAV